MEENDRPGGLTALAVINFIFAAFNVIAVLGTLLAKVFINSIPMDQVSETQAAQIAAAQEAFQNMSGAILLIIVLIGAIKFLLLLLSGIGYLKQKKVRLA